MEGGTAGNLALTFHVCRKSGHEFRPFTLFVTHYFDVFWGIDIKKAKPI